MILGFQRLISTGPITHWLEYLHEDFDGRPIGKLNWEPNRLAHLWQTHVAIGPVQPYNDYPTISGSRLLVTGQLGSFATFSSPTASCWRSRPAQEHIMLTTF